MTMNGRAFHHRWADSARRFGRESWSLTKQLVRSLLQKRKQRQQPESPLNWKQACVTLVQEDDNRLARGLLNFDKELHLLRYHGLRNYLRLEPQHSQTNIVYKTIRSVVLFSWLQPYMAKDVLQQQHAPISNNHNSSNDVTATELSSPSTNTGNKDTVVKIPFVITTTMKQDLTKVLGYDAAEIKRMTPLHATLLLQHSVSPPQKEAELPRLMRQHEAQLQQQQQEQQERLHQQHQQQQQQLQEEKEEEEQAQHREEATTTASKTADSDTSSSTATTTSSSTAATKSPSVSSPSSPSSSPKRGWYRVVEVVHLSDATTMSSSSSSSKDESSYSPPPQPTVIHVAVGLHKTLEEAQQDCELRQELADRNTAQDRSSPKRVFCIESPPLENENDDTMTSENKTEGEEEVKP